MSFIKFPKWAIQLINSRMALCLWNDTENKRKFHLVNWPTVTLNKEYGGLGIPDLRHLNVCLLASWIKRYEMGRDKLWRSVIDSKYNTDKPNMLWSRDIGASKFWQGVLWDAQAAKMGYKWKVGDGKKIKFWEDVWF